MDHAVLQPLRVGLSRFAAYMFWRVFERQPYGVVIESLIRGSVDAVRQHCPAKRLTPMGLMAGESARCFANFIDEIGYFDMYFEWKCGYYRKRLREDFMILGGKLERL